MFKSSKLHRETESLKAKIDENINEIRDYFEQNSDQLIATFSNNLDDIITVLNFENQHNISTLQPTTFTTMEQTFPPFLM